MKLLEIALPIVAIVLTCYFNHEKKTGLDIKTISEVKLTQFPDLEDISVSYMYHDSIPVGELWQSTYVVRNVGETTIYGRGFVDCNINDTCIFLHVSNCDNVLSMVLDAENNGACLIGQGLQICQWRPQEYVTITLITEGESAPCLLINDRDVKNAIITYSVYSPENPSYDRRLIDRIPLLLSKILKWLYVIVACIIFLSVLISVPQTIMAATSKTSRFASWFVLIALLLLMVLPIMWMF